MNSGMPPLRFQRDSAGVVVFTSDIPRYCGTAKPGYVILACHRVIEGVSVIFMPNPCPLGEVSAYAKIMCHENAHRPQMGWSGNHEM